MVDFNPPGPLISVFHTSSSFHPFLSSHTVFNSFPRTSTSVFYLSDTVWLLIPSSTPNTVVYFIVTRKILGFWISVVDSRRLNVLKEIFTITERTWPNPDSIGGQMIVYSYQCRYQPGRTTKYPSPRTYSIENGDTLNNYLSLCVYVLCVCVCMCGCRSSPDCRNPGPEQVWKFTLTSRDPFFVQRPTMSLPSMG